MAGIVEKKNDDLFARAGKTVGEAGRARRDENSGNISSYESLEHIYIFQVEK